MKTIVFDTGAIISLAMNDLLWTLRTLKQRFEVSFYIPESVKYELVDKSLNSKKYKFEAIMIQKLISENVLQVYKKINVDPLLDSVNSIFNIKNHNLKLIHLAELEALALYNTLNADLYVIDERTMRLFVESPLKLKRLLERKFQSKIDVNKQELNEFQAMFKNVKISRTTELMAVAYEQGLFKDFNVSKNDFLDGLFWALKLRGVSISGDEIKELVNTVK